MLAKQGQFMSANKCDQIGVADCLILFLVTAAIGIAFYHPYYFGDELLPFSYAQRPGSSLWSVFDSLNKYKPRLLFNGVWAIFAYYSVPRYVLMMLTVCATGSTASLLYYIARKQFGVSRSVSLVTGLIVPTSRFANLIYFDYLSGTIESLSAFIFLFAVTLVISPEVFPFSSKSGRYKAILLACIAAIFVHERYVAGIFALGIVWTINQLRLEGGINSKKIFAGCIIMLLPLLLFVTATNAFGALSLNTGTSGTAVIISFDIFWRMLRYCENVFFGLNAGYPWLVGSLQYSGLSNVLVLSGLACSFAFCYFAIFTFLRSKVDWWNVAGLVLIAAALIGVASLPADTRQEGRWMIPVYILVAYAALHFGRARGFFLLLLLTTNLTYGLKGSYQDIANVVGSNTVKALAGPLNYIAPEGRRGVVINAPNNGDAWVLGSGHNDPELGRAFSKLNFDSKISLDPGVVPGRTYDFGLYYTGVDSHQSPTFSYVDRNDLRLILNPKDIPDNEGRTVAGIGSWDNWRWNESVDIRKSDEFVTLRPGVIGLASFPVRELDHKVIVYRARALAGDSVAMRIQINWVDSKGRFLSAFIRVVHVNSSWGNFVAVVAAPSGASSGVVYACLHDGAVGRVALSSIRLIDGS